jgi:hypothetical protein
MDLESLIDRSALNELEARVVKNGALATCQFGDVTLACFVDPSATDLDDDVVIARADGDDWAELERFGFWTDAQRALGPLIDASIEQVPIDDEHWPSPTMVIPLTDGGIEVCCS